MYSSEIQIPVSSRDLFFILLWSQKFVNYFWCEGCPPFLIVLTFVPRTCSELEQDFKSQRKKKFNRIMNRYNLYMNDRVPFCYIYIIIFKFLGRNDVGNWLVNYSCIVDFHCLPENEISQRQKCRYIYIYTDKICTCCISF